jgi:hypothetical protein
MRYAVLQKLWRFQCHCQYYVLCVCTILIKTVTSYLDLILHHHLQSSPLRSAHTNPSVSATFEMHPGSLSLLGCLVPSAFPLEFDFHLGEEKEVAWR